MTTGDDRGHASSRACMLWPVGTTPAVPPLCRAELYGLPDMSLRVVRPRHTYWIVGPLHTQSNTRARIRQGFGEKRRQTKVSSAGAEAASR